MSEDTASRRQAALAKGPIILYGTPSPEEIAEARGHAGSRGILVLPEALRDSMVASGGGWTAPPLDEYRASHADEPYDPDALTFSEETMFKVQAAITGEGIWGEKCLDIIAAMQRAGILFRESADSSSETGFDLKSDDDRESPVEESEMATMAEEPISERLRRAWLNGFREGVDRAASSVESWGRWDS